MEIVSEFPSWFIGLCVLGAIVYAVALYTRDRTNRHFPGFLLILLGLFRFAVVLVLALFLLKPLVKTIDREVERPIVVIAQDNSESIVSGEDSTLIKSQYSRDIRLLRDALKEDYDVRAFSFGENVDEGIDSLDFTDKVTDFSNFLDDMYDRFSNRNLGAIVVASDGLYNRGVSPVFASGKLESPVFTIALGDTTEKKDVLIKEVLHNRLAYLGNKFPVEIRVDSRKTPGERVQVKISRAGQVVFSQAVDFAEDYTSDVIRTNLDADKTGIQRYTITISAVEGEFTLANNRKDIFIDVLDSRQKILVVADSPHPDLNAFSSAIESNKNYQVDLDLVGDLSGNLNEYNLIIFHQVPGGSRKGLDIVEEALAAEIPSLFVLGSQTNFAWFNNLDLGFSLKNNTGIINDIHPGYRSGFSLFKLDDETRNAFRKYPPLQVPFGDFQQSPGVNALLNQRVGLIDTDNALLGFNKVNDVKVGVLAGEGIWRWRMISFLYNDSHRPFDRFVSKCVQYLASKEDKSFFRVSGENDLLENETISFDAELYNDSYEPVNDAEVQLLVTDESGQEFEFAFGRRGTGFHLDAGSLPVGNYQYVARTSYSGKSYTQNGEFSISPVQLELRNSRADHQMLFNFAEANGGTMVYPSEISSLTNLIAQQGNTASVAHETKILTDLINSKWILWLLLAFLCIEWLLRKRNGTY